MDHTLQVLFAACWIGPGCTQNGTTLKVNIRHVGDSKPAYVVRIALDQTGKTVVNTNHFKIGILSLDSYGANDAIDARSWPSAHQNAETMGSVVQINLLFCKCL